MGEKGFDAGAVPEAAPEPSDAAEIRELTEQRQFDAAALQIVERVRETLDTTEVLQRTLDELGPAMDASRALIQLRPNDEGTSLMIEYDRGDTRPLGLVPPTPIAERAFSTGEAVIVEDIEESPDEALREYLRAAKSAALITLPVRWRNDVVAAVGFEDDRPRRWRDHALPLLQRLEPQLAAAVVHAELHAQQREALKQLENVSRMREELIANVSHELRTPMAAIVGLTKTLRRPDIELDDERRREMLATLDDQAQRLAMLAEDLLDLSRFARGTQTLAVAPIRAQEVVDRCLGGVAVPEGRRIDVEVGDLVLEVDRNRICQVVENLVTNAVRHGAGNVSVRGFEDGRNAVLVVSDEGGGVPAEYAEEMFEAFSRRSDRSDSSGLGLAIARRIVEAHGGTLTYLPPRDADPHQFVVTLPAAARTS